MALGVVVTNAKEAYKFQAEGSLSHLKNEQQQHVHIEREELDEIESIKGSRLTSSEDPTNWRPHLSSNESPMKLGQIDYDINKYKKRFENMSPDAPSSITCGALAKIVPGHQFTCWDYIEQLRYDCVGRADMHYQCWDGEEWEWANYNENDGTPDNSLLTSIITDGILHTSPSIDGDDGDMGGDGMQPIVESSPGTSNVDRHIHLEIENADVSYYSPETSVASNDDL